MSRLVVFDLDGTVIDSLADIHASVNHALSSVGLPPRSLEEVRSFVGEGERRLLERAVAPRDDLVAEARLSWREHYQAHLLDHTRPYPGIPEMLRASSCVLSVLTNKPADMGRRILEGLGLLHLFAAVLGGGEAPRKPDPTGLRSLMVRLDATAAETLLVGDSRVDVDTGRAAGVRVVAVTWGLGNALDLKGADRLVDQPSELLPFLCP